MNEIKRILAGGCEGFRRLNPHLGGLSASQPKPELRRALEQAPQAPEKRPRRMADSTQPKLRCTLIYYSNARPLDSDNRSHGYKSLRDAIAQSMNLDDNDATIEWEYQEVRTRGKRGTIVRIEML